MRLHSLKTVIGFSVAASLLAAACAAPPTAGAGGGTEPTFQDETPLGSGELSGEEAACLDFYSSVYESTEEEVLYFRRFAERIEQLGHADAAAVLWDLAEQWETGVWESETAEEAPERTMSAQLALAGDSLASRGHIRCADLAEVLGVDGYRGEPTPDELAERQREIWTANGIDDYRLLVARVPEDASNLTQYHVEVVDGQVERVLDAETGEQIDLGTVDLPLTVDEIYQQMNQRGPLATSYDLVDAVPTSVGSMYIKFDLHEFPDPLVPAFEEE